MSLSKNLADLVELSKKQLPAAAGSIYSFKVQKVKVDQVRAQALLASTKKQLFSSLAQAISSGNVNEELMKLCAQFYGMGLDHKDFENTVKRLITLSETLKPVLKDPDFKLKIPTFPSEIKSDMMDDIREMQRCFSAGCYRACAIICGRLLEMALHRKYFDSTGQDILEKNPGIGLGTLIAKMKEKNIELDPALTQQIHLINQVRVFSVHVKQESFYPSKEQGLAIMLYTMDTLNKLFIG
jgi:hypothetical protein